ncbi:putative amidohydrolase [Ameyamaea chiangmaiensis NBRC 103196]|uniref:Carbon-nitrogen hydrolase family protein n=1 Tax=Ameyamaea chiangmaiensis TaxID=442969 RepID=A0A850P3E1_9PROT|nr:carbon-nitrogen hydrolase family protein [Ameyamaea chiangmaiensis]MBS4073817.1 carbon-nitrogen hydrolase family protein [Ameyamaea chiangmaiensis]NVN39187.1 carbon-nitrogen hydrolase family protein [Ameyamaea chiangmaiensis]GBQ68320.1 putative amidohydrolase [Ameyamaea chiangmaiensis NBRC 103196]
MSRSLRLAVGAWHVERATRFEDFEAHLDRMVSEAAPRADLLLLPEYACMEVVAALTDETDPTAELHAACDRSDDILAAMVAVAKRHRVWLMPGTLPRPEATRIRNRAPLIAPDGTVAFQDKHVMTRFESESWGVQAGNPPGVFVTPWGRIGTAICYDSEFPMLTRAQIDAGAWLILVPTCTDTMHGFNRVRLSAQARALENQCFVAVSPTVGAAPWLATLDHNHGCAGVYGPVDRGFADDGVVVEGALDQSGWVFATLDPACLTEVQVNGGVRNRHDWPASVPPANALMFSVNKTSVPKGI